MSSTIDLELLTYNLGQAYKAWKSNEKRKNELKEEFFEELTNQIDKHSAATKIEYIEGVQEWEPAREIALKRNPGWKIIGTHLESHPEGDFFYVTLQEDLSYKPAAYVNKVDGMVYQRTVVEGPVLLDDETLKAQDPELWAAITQTRVIEEVRPFEELDGDTLEAIAKYLYKGQPQVKFLAPRPAREDELVGE